MMPEQEPRSFPSYCVTALAFVEALAWSGVHVEVESTQ